MSQWKGNKGGGQNRQFFISGVTSILATLYFVHSVPPQFKMDLFQQFYLLPLFYFVSCMHIRYSTRNWTAASGVSVNRRVRLGGSRQRRVWFCMPETFWRGRERERERDTAGTTTALAAAADGDGDGDKVSKLSGKLGGAICSRQSSSQSVSQSVGYAGRQGKSLEGSRKRKILPVRASHPFRSSRRNLG